MLVGRFTVNLRVENCDNQNFKRFSVVGVKTNDFEKATVPNGLMVSLPNSPEGNNFDSLVQT